MFNIIYREGIRKIQSLGLFGNGRIVFTKLITDDLDVSDFLTELISKLRFPGKISFDAHGFLETSKGQPIFTFGSPNSAIILPNDKQVFKLRGADARVTLLNFLAKMTLEKFTDDWFNIHDATSELVASGLKVRRIIALVVIFDPSDTSVNKLL